MLELVAAASIISALLLFSSRRFRSRDRALSFDTSGWHKEYLEAGDLPCPWCQSPTRETDRECPACGRAFGVSLST